MIIMRDKGPATTAHQEEALGNQIRHNGERPHVCRVAYKPQAM
jgi:hypothetical protein